MFTPCISIKVLKGGRTSKYRAVFKDESGCTRPCRTISPNYFTYIACTLAICTHGVCFCVKRYIQPKYCAVPWRVNTTTRITPKEPHNIWPVISEYLPTLCAALSGDCSSSTELSTLSYDPNIVKWWKFLGHCI